VAARTPLLSAITFLLRVFQREGKRMHFDKDRRIHIS
jgi:hypothetical protein